jgi:hypothetical protein
MRVLMVMTVLSMLTACASQPCRGRLSPVNGPVTAPVSTEAAPVPMKERVP